jgi:hypothetical protein
MSRQCAGCLALIQAALRLSGFPAFLFSRFPEIPVSLLREKRFVGGVDD